MTDMRERIAKIIAVHSLGGKDGFVLNSTVVADALTAILAENERLREALEKIEQQSAYGQIDICNRLAIEALGADQ